jgi:hypothetical protein
MKYKYSQDEKVSLANAPVSHMNEGISYAVSLLSKPGHLNKRANLKNPLILSHLKKASNAVLSAASHESSRHQARAQMSIDSSLLHFREAAKHMMMDNRDKALVMNAGMRYLEMTDAPQEMIERHKNWQEDVAILGSDPFEAKPTWRDKLKETNNG